VIWITQKLGSIVSGGRELKIMTSIYLIRHGQTAWNKEEVFRGRTDIPLDETGLRQAELAGEYFRGLEIHGIYSSPLSRAWETAQKIAQFHNLEVQPLQGILDMSFGNWEGHSHQEIQKIDRETYRRWREEPHYVRLPGGESLDDVRKPSWEDPHPRISPRRQQGADLRDFGFGQLPFLADHPRYNGHQPDSTQRWKVHSIGDERDLPPQSA
jgi:bisphosphoglycerate-dependent phosphoglycerate mutase